MKMGIFLDMITSKGKGANSTYRPPPGTVCEVSGPNCDDDRGYVYVKMTVIWCDAEWALFRHRDCWPVVYRWDHVLCRPLQEPEPPQDVRSASYEAHLDKVTLAMTIDWCDDLFVLYHTEHDRRTVGKWQDMRPVSRARLAPITG